MTRKTKIGPSRFVPVPPRQEQERKIEIMERELERIKGLVGVDPIEITNQEQKIAQERLTLSLLQD